jgi:hypothetical protein
LARDIGFVQFEESDAGSHHHSESVVVEGDMAQGAMSLMLEVDIEQEEERVNQRVERTRWPAPLTRPVSPP